MQGHDAVSHAVAALAVCDDVRPGAGDDQPANRGAGDADDRPLPGRTLLRHAGGRIRGSVGTLLLDLRTSGGVRADPAGIRVRERDYSGVLAEGDLRVSSDGCGERGHWIYQPGRVGPPHVHDWNDVLRKRILYALDDAGVDSYRN